MSKYIGLLIFFALIFLIYCISLKIGQKYDLTIDEKKMIVKRGEVTQTIQMADIKKASIKRRSVILRGDFLVSLEAGRSWRVSTIELTNNKKNDIVRIKSFLMENGF